MRIRIKGTYKKIGSTWNIEFRAVQLAATAPSPFQALKQIEREIQFECLFQIHDSGIITLEVSDKPPVIEFIASRLKTTHLSNITFEPDL